MKPAPFKYLAPRGLKEAVGALREFGSEAKVLAGGQSLVPLLAMRLARPSVLVDLNRLRALSFVRRSSEEVTIGAMTRQREAERHRVVASKVPLLGEALRQIGHPQIRNRGTVGGSMAHADPSAELPAAASVLGASFLLVSERGERVVGCEEFFAGYLATALEPDELLAEIRFPVPPPGTGWAFCEVARRHGDFALVGVAVLLLPDGSGGCAGARVALTGVGAGPVRIPEAEAALSEARPGDGGGCAAAAVEAASIVRGAIDPPSDIHATSDYRRQLAGVLVERAVVQAAKRAGIHR